MSAPVVYILRHGQTGWNAAGRLQGQADTPLSALGRTQAEANGRSLSALIGTAVGFDFVASPLWRTRETMERMRGGMGLAPGAYRVDTVLKEVHFGDWQGFTLAEAEKRWPGAVAQRNADKWNFRPPGEAAESYAMLLERVRPFFAAIARPSVVVTHGGVIRCLFAMQGMAGGDAASLDIVQDRVLRWQDGRVEWL